MVVYLVGAGPGDPDLITLKGKRLIQEADIVIYDKLVNKKILDWVNPYCKIIYKGKNESDSDNSEIIQLEINSFIKKYGKSSRIVRLKGGDPFIFGRGGEEAQICSEQGIPFEIVPGISSFYAVPAYAGIPLTHRDLSSSFAVLTGHESNKAKSTINWNKLPDTIVILMGVKNIKRIASKLINSGRDPKTPVAAIQWGTRKCQKIEINSLEQLIKKGIMLEPPVIFVVGDVVKLHYQLNWFERKLQMGHGKNVLLVETKNHQNERVELLNSYGFNVDFMPVIEIIPKEFELPNLNSFDALIFTSIEGIKNVENRAEIGKFKGLIFAIGPKTKRFLSEKYNVNISIGEKYNSQGLAEHIIKNMKKNSSILAFRSSAASKVLYNLLSVHFKYKEIQVYDIKHIPYNINQIKKSEVIFVTSASSAKSLMDFNDSRLDEKLIVSIGPETSRQIPIPHITSTVHTVGGMAEAYLKYLWEKS